MIPGRYVLDLFACEGGATEGYQRAGYSVIAVDKDKNRLRYNCAEYVMVADAFDVLRSLIADGYFTLPNGREVMLVEIALIHMSPPCQYYTRGNAGRKTDWPRLIGTCRELAIDTGIPYVIENVADAHWDMRNPTTLCGCMFGLTAIDDDGIRLHMQRPRLFESSFSMAAPKPCDHSEHVWVGGAYGGARRDKYEAKYVRKGGYVPPNIDVVQNLLGVEHRMSWRGLFESIPPAYAEYVASQLKGFYP